RAIQAGATEAQRRVAKNVSPGRGGTFQKGDSRGNARQRERGVHYPHAGQEETAAALGLGVTKTKKGSATNLCCRPLFVFPSRSRFPLLPGKKPPDFGNTVFSHTAVEDLYQPLHRAARKPHVLPAKLCLFFERKWVVKNAVMNAVCNVLNSQFPSPFQLGIHY